MLVRQFEFTCLSEKRRSQHGFFVKGQKFILRDGDPRLQWFRSGGWQEKELQPIDVNPAQVNVTGGVTTIPVDKLVGVSTNAINALKTAGIETVGDLLLMKEEDLLATPGIGQATLDKIHAALKALDQT
jgi:hypothetical protein